MCERPAPGECDDFRARFIRAWTDCGGRNAAESYRRLLECYACGRVYHRFDHIAAIFTVADEILGSDALSPEQTIAIFYHDAVCSPGNHDNEAQSAELLRRELGADAPPEIVDHIATLILATEHHRADDADAQLIIDLDLSFLGLDKEAFRMNVEKLVSEFSHLSRHDFLEGQKQYLQPFLDRRHIYYTTAFRTRFEDQARDNLKHFIEQQS